jgi:hypothetical protein
MAPERDLELASVWKRLRDLRLQRVELFTMLGTLAEIVASTGVLVQDDRD